LTNGNGDVHVNGNVNGNENYAVASPSLSPVVDKAISDVDTEEESEHKNVEAPSSENDSVVNGSRDIIKEEVQPTPAPAVEETPAVPETESTPVEPAAVEERKDLLEEKAEEAAAAAAALLPVAVVEAQKEISQSGADLPAQPVHESKEITENKDISHDDTEPSHIEAPREPENDLPAGNEPLPSVALEVEEAKEIAHSEPEVSPEPAHETEESIENKETESGEPPLEPETVRTELEANHSGEEHAEPLAAESAENEPVAEHEGNPEAEKRIEATAEHEASHSDGQHVEPSAAETEPTVDSHEETPEAEKEIEATAEHEACHSDGQHVEQHVEPLAAEVEPTVDSEPTVESHDDHPEPGKDIEAPAEHEIQPTSEATEQVETPEVEEPEATKMSEISEHDEETPVPEQPNDKEIVDESPAATEQPEPSEKIEETLAVQEQLEVHEHAEEIPVKESQEDSTQPEHPPLEHTTTEDETVPEPRDLDAELEASPEHDSPALEEPTINADQEVLLPATEAVTTQEESPSHMHTAAADVQSEELAEKQDEVPRDVGEVADEREADDGKKVLPQSEGERLDEPAVLGDAGIALVGGLSTEVAEEKETHDAHDEAEGEKSLDTPAQVEESKEIAHESDATPLNASEHDNFEVNAEPNSTPADGTNVIQENHTDEKIATVEPALEVLDAESEPAAAVLPEHEASQEKELKEPHDIEPSEAAHEASQSESKDPTTEIAHEDEHQEVDPTPAHIEPEDESKKSGLEAVQEQEHHHSPADDVSNELPNGTDHHEETIPEAVHSEEQSESHVENLMQHETSEISSEHVPVEDVVTESISPVEEEAQLQDSAAEETPSTAAGEEHLSSEENSKEISTEPEPEVAVAEGEPTVHEKEGTPEEHETEQPSVVSEQQEEVADVPAIPTEHLNAPDEVEHSTSPADLGEEIEHPEHNNLEASASKDASEEVESEAVPHESSSLPEDAHPTSVENEVEEEPVSHSEPAKDSSVADLPAQENVSDEHLDKELESAASAAHIHVVGEHESTKETDDVVADTSHENEHVPTTEAGHSDVPAVDEVASKEVTDEVAAEGGALESKDPSEDSPLTEQVTAHPSLSESLSKDALDVGVPAVIALEMAKPDEEIAHSEAQVETEQPRDIKSPEVEQLSTENNHDEDDVVVPVTVHDETHPISHKTLSENHEQDEQDSDETLTISAPAGGEEAPNHPSDALIMAEKEIPDWETHGVSLSEASDAYLEDSDKPFSDTTTRDYNDMASAASATSEPSNPRLDVFRYLEPETTETADTTTDANDTTEAEADDTMDEESLVDGAPLNGSTGPQEERTLTPVQHPVVAIASHINRFAESPATVLNTDDLFDDDTDSEHISSEEGDDADQEDEDEDDDEETCDDSEEDSDETVPEPAVPSKIERSFPHVVNHMPSYEFGKPKMVDPFSEGSHEQVDFSSSHRSSGLFASLVDTIKSDIPAVKQMADNGESSHSLRPDENDEYHSLSDYSQATPRAKEVPNAFQETDGEETPFHDTFSHHEGENLHVRSHTADTVPSFESFAQSDVESTPSETPSSPFQEIPKQEPRIESSWSFNEQGEEHGELKPEDSPLRAEFDPYGTKNYPKYITPKPSEANLRSPRSSRVSQSVDGTEAQYNRRDSVSSMSSNPSARRLRRTESNEAALSEGRLNVPSQLARFKGANRPPARQISDPMLTRPIARARNSTPSRTPSLREGPPINPSPPTQQPTTTAANSSAKTTVPATHTSSSFFQKTRSLFESSALPAASPPSSATRPLSGYFNVGRGASTSPSPQLQRKGSMASLRSIPPPLEEEDVLVPRSLDGDGKPPSPAFTIPRRDSTTSQRKSSHGSISRVENDLTPFIPSKNIRPRNSNPFLGLARTLGGERGLEDSIHNPDRERALQHQPLLSGGRRDSWGDGGASLGNGNRS
jgi:hypothetical protein